MRYCFLTFICLLASGCASKPAEWANDLGGKLRCGMSTAEVQALAKRTIEPLDRDWGTHFIRDGSTDMWLTFDRGQLKAYQIAWVRPLTVVESNPRVDLCSSGK
jgi:hypothetical protein